MQGPGVYVVPAMAPQRENTVKTEAGTAGGGAPPRPRTNPFDIHFPSYGARTTEVYIIRFLDPHGLLSHV